MKVILIIGKGNVGKTTSLNVIYDILLNNNETFIIIPPKQEGANPKDFSSVINYKGKSIAFFTMGDKARIVKKAIINYNSYDYVICTCNLNFKATINSIKNKYDASIILKNCREHDITNDILLLINETSIF